MTARFSFVLLRHRAKNPPHCHSKPLGEESARYARNGISMVERGDSPVRGNVCYNRVGRGLAPAVRCLNSENFAPAAGFAVNYGTVKTVPYGL